MLCTKPLLLKVSILHQGYISFFITFFTTIEQHAMEDYVGEALQQEYICPSTSPASAGFFFVKKKGGGLWPCINYDELNQITVKYRNPLPLVPFALEQVRSAKIFTMLELCSAYNLICIREGDEWKGAFSTTSGHSTALCYMSCLVPPQSSNA